MKLLNVLLFIVLLSVPAYSRMVVGGTSSVMLGMSQGGGGGGLMLGYLNESNGLEVISYTELVGMGSVYYGDQASNSNVIGFGGLQEKITIGGRFDINDKFSVSGYGYIAVAGLYGGDGVFSALGNKSLVNIEFGGGGGIMLIFNKNFAFYTEGGGLGSSYLYGGKSLNGGNGGARITMGFRSGRI